jgi:hypothetical protein
MKTILQSIFGALLLISTTANAQQRVALHSSGVTTIFSSVNPFLDAYNASIDGDTIYLPGGTFTPPTNFEKKLVIFGAGHYVDSTMTTGKTFINGNVQFRENADNFHIEGVEITGGVTLYNNESINGVIIKRCKINGALNVNGDLTNPSTNLNIIGNIIIQQINLANAQTAILSNNIIVKTFVGSNSNLFSNNIIMGYIWGSSHDYVFYGNNNTLNNNIILWTGYNADVNGYGNIFNNNLYVEETPNYGTTPTALNNYTNIPQIDIFVNQTGVAFNYAHDYHLQNPATYLGTDGTEIGIYGGMFPYKEGAVPNNPHIQLKNITPTTDNNGDLNIQLKVEAQDN